LGAIGTEADRDALRNRALYRRPCAKEKTRADVAKIAKAKRQAGETGQRAKRAAGKTKAIPKRKLEGGARLPTKADRERVLAMRERE
jgi:hypothetical protein